MRKSIVAGLLAVLALAPSAPAAAAPLSLAAGESYEFTVVQGDSVRLIGEDDFGQVVISHRYLADVVFDVECLASRPRLDLERNELDYRVSCRQRKP